MKSIDSRLEELQVRVMRMERRLFKWQVSAGVLAFVAIAGLGVRLNAQPGNRFTVPFVVYSQDGKRPVFGISEGAVGKMDKAVVAWFYADGHPSAALATATDVYRKTTDDKDRVLNELRTYLVDQEKGWDKNGNPNIVNEVTSLALTDAGGSLVVLNRPDKAASTPTFAARLTSKDTGGVLTLYLKNGKTETLPK